MFIFNKFPLLIINNTPISLIGYTLVLIKNLVVSYESKKYPIITLFNIKNFVAEVRSTQGGVAIITKGLFGYKPVGYNKVEIVELEKNLHYRFQDYPVVSIESDSELAHEVAILISREKFSQA